jgi:hypothetical protein
MQSSLDQASGRVVMRGTSPKRLTAFRAGLLTSRSRTVFAAFARIAYR